jgi:hypothetical protein
VEKEWLWFGHKFHERTGHHAKENDQQAPIFMQWLEAVWNLTLQFPTQFEFNSSFLLALVDNLNSVWNRRACFALRSSLSPWLLARLVPLWNLFVRQCEGATRAQGAQKVCVVMDLPQALPEVSAGGCGADGMYSRNVTGTNPRPSRSAQAGKFTNPFFKPEPHRVVLYPTASPKRVQIWADFWLRWVPYEFLSGETRAAESAALS